MVSVLIERALFSFLQQYVLVPSSSKLPTQQTYSTYHSPHSTSLALPLNALGEFETRGDRRETGRAMQKLNLRQKGALCVCGFHLFAYSFS